MNKKALIFAVSLGLISPSLHADWTGILDLKKIAIALDQLYELRQQYQQLKDAYEVSQQQVEKINQLKDMHKGNYGFGDLENGADELLSWQSPTATWKDALENLSGGNRHRYRDLVEAYEKNHPVIDEQQYKHNASPVHFERFKEDKAVNRAALVQTTDAYNDINKHIKTLHQLSKKIEKTKNTKGAIDLNSRLVAELGYIQLMTLRLQAIVNQQMAQEGLSDLQDRAELAQFNHWKS